MLNPFISCKKVFKMSHINTADSILSYMQSFRGCEHPLKSARKIILRLSFLVLILFACNGCASYKIPTQAFLDKEENQISDTRQFCNQKAALEHPLYRVVPRHRCQIRWFDLGHWATWMLFGNDDDGIFGEESSAHYHLEEKISAWKALRWACRNPLHNFCFYVIGTAYTTNSEFTFLKIDQEQFCFCTYRRSGGHNFGKGTSFFLGFHGWKPFFSLQLLYTPKWRGQFYLGWRERGNFGIKMLPCAKRKKK